MRAKSAIGFGLNAVKIKDFKGRVRGLVRPHHDQRSTVTGRFTSSQRKASESGFEPKGNLLSSQSFIHGEFGRTWNGKKTLLICNPPN
ncbi:hypothetical protein [Rouxiella sp. WC2420]|uniref:Uncharacterized protein n=1 Tax=Rouxiella sp. WC2420 TaxID=3234145 RepID=A0AB39VUQ3_9GAMM